MFFTGNAAIPGGDDDGIPESAEPAGSRVFPHTAFQFWGG
jgi:hypothetical protein